MGNLIKNGKQDCSLPTPADKPDLDDAWRRGGGGEGGTFPMFLREKFIRTQERKKIVTVLKYCKGYVPGLEAAQHANNLILSRDQRIPY